jgi:hypothetical protein
LITKAIALLVGGILIMSLIAGLLNMLLHNVGCQVWFALVTMVGLGVVVLVKTSKNKPSQAPEPTPPAHQLPPPTSQGAGSLYVPREHPGNR